MYSYQKIAVIFVRGLAVFFLVSTMVEIGIIAADTIFVRTGIYYRSEIAFRPRLMEVVFYFLASMFLYSQSKQIANVLAQGLIDEREDTEVKNDQPAIQD